MEKDALERKSGPPLGPAEQRNIEFVAEIEGYLTAESSSHRRVRAVRILSALGGSEAVASLMLAAQSPDRRVRHVALDSLLKLAPPEASQLMIETLKSSDQRDVRVAAWTLTKLGDTAAIPALSAATDGVSTSTKLSVLRAVRKLEEQTTSSEGQ